MFKSYNLLNGTKNLIYEDDQSIILEEASTPQGTRHLLVVPKRNISILYNALTDDKKLLGHLILVANNVAMQRGFGSNSYQITINEDPESGNVKSIHLIWKNILQPMTPNSKL